MLACFKTMISKEISLASGFFLTDQIMKIFANLVLVALSTTGLK